MRYIESNETNVKYYDISYDKEKLNDILDKLKDYSYPVKKSYWFGGNIINKWLATEKNIRKRVIKFFGKNKKFIDTIIYPETIIHHTEDNKNYVTFDYSYNKLPDLYDYIDIIINDKPVINYLDLLSKISEEKHSLNMFYVAAHWEQLVLEGLLNYANSEELTNHNSIDDNKDYDYEGLNKLYNETLKCFNFNLVAIKEYLKEPEKVDTFSLKLNNKK